MRSEIREAAARRGRADTRNLVGGAPPRLHVGRLGLEALVVIEVLERRSVEQVRARFADGSHLCTAGAPELRVVIRGEDLELANALDADRRTVIVVFRIDV